MCKGRYIFPGPLFPCVCLYVNLGGLGVRGGGYEWVLSVHVPPLDQSSIDNMSEDHEH